MFGIYTKIISTDGKRGKLAALLLQAAQAMGTVEGSILYIVNESATEPDVIWVTEVWDRKENHTASLSLETSKNLISQAMPLIAKAPEQIVLNPIGGKGI